MGLGALLSFDTLSFTVRRFARAFGRIYRSITLRSGLGIRSVVGRFCNLMTGLNITTGIIVMTVVPVSSCVQGGGTQSGSAEGGTYGGNRA